MLMMTFTKSTSPSKFYFQMKDSLKHLATLTESIGSISPPVDIAHFVGGQNVQVKMYPPPKAQRKTPELPPPKVPDAPPVDLVR